MKNNRRWGKLLFLVILVFVVLFLAVLSYKLIAVHGTFAHRLPVSQARGEAIIAGVAGHRIAGRMFLNSSSPASSTLVVVLHGDAPYVNPRYQYGVAAEIANAVPSTRAVALLRPGYADPYGGKSEGDRGFSSGETYTPDVVNDIAAAIQELKLRWNTTSVILVGHSGGAAVTANVAALHPGLVQHAFLVGCPCDVAAFREHMWQLQRTPLWLLPTHSLSPIQTLEQMKPGTVVTAISGSDDPITLPQYAHAYVAKATAQGITASMITIPGKDHEILEDPVVIEAVEQAARKGS